jgi:CRP-like cAMP-binding protein
VRVGVLTHRRATQPAAKSVTVRGRARLAAAEGFRDLPASTLDTLAGLSEARAFAAGEIIIAEGDSAGEVFIALDGAATVTATGPQGQVELAPLGPGDVFGEMAALAPEGTRQATVTALTALVAIALPGVAFREAVAAHPEALQAFGALAERRLLAKFFLTLSPFASLERGRLEGLVARVEPIQLPAGEVLFRQGERGDACYLIRGGR